MRERNTEKSKLMILSAAEQEFAQKGFFGARVDEIAARAKINKRMIYAYFGDKEALYLAVLTQVYKRMETAEQKLISQNCTGKQLICEIVSTYFDFLQDNPTFVNILMWENLNQGKYLKQIERSQIERNTIRYFIQSIEQSRQDGTFRSNIDPWHTALSLITTCFANFSNQYTLAKLFHADLSKPEMIEQRKQHTIQIILSYLYNATDSEAF